MTVKRRMTKDEFVNAHHSKESQERIKAKTKALLEEIDASKKHESNEKEKTTMTEKVNKEDIPSFDVSYHDAPYEIDVDKTELIDAIAMGRFYEEILNSADDGSLFSDSPIYNDEGGFTPQYEETFQRHYDQAAADVEEYTRQVTEELVEFYFGTENEND